MMRRMWLSAMWNGRDGIEGRGYRVLRFKNADVLCNPGAVAKQIFAVVEQRTRRRL
jgi:very-short-patch-repair endonuclease